MISLENLANLWVYVVPDGQEDKIERVVVDAHQDIIFVRILFNHRNERGMKLRLCRAIRLDELELCVDYLEYIKRNTTYKYGPLFES